MRSDADQEEKRPVHLLAETRPASKKVQRMDVKTGDNAISTNWYFIFRIVGTHLGSESRENVACANREMHHFANVFYCVETTTCHQAACSGFHRGCRGQIRAQALGRVGGMRVDPTTIFGLTVLLLG